MNPWTLWPEPPRAWQVEALPVAVESVRSGAPCIVQASTGSGKSRLLAALCFSLLPDLGGRESIVLTYPRTKLVDQTLAQFRAVGLPSSRWDGRSKRGSRIIHACQDSLPTLTETFRRHGWACRYMVSDECHRTETATYRDALEALQPRGRIGLTATPYRSTAGLPGWSRLVYSYAIDQAVSDGVLVPLELRLWDGADGADTNAAVAEMIRRMAPEGPGLVDAVDVDDAEWYAAFLTERGIPAKAVHSYQRKSEQEAALADLLSGKLRAVVHVDLLAEGVDIPGLRWLACRRNRKSAVSIVQQVGRIMRVMRPDDPTAWAGPKTSAVCLLPYRIPIIDSLHKQADFSAADGARLLRKAAQKELEPVETETLLPPAEAAAQLGQWFVQVVEQVSGVYRHWPDRPDASRQGIATSAQIAAIRRYLGDGPKNPARWLPADVRGGVRAMMGRPELLTYQAASDLLWLLASARAEAARWYRQPGRSRKHFAGVRGIRVGPPGDGEVSALTR